MTEWKKREANLGPVDTWLESLLGRCGIIIEKVERLASTTDTNEFEALCKEGLTIRLHDKHVEVRGILPPHVYKQLLMRNYRSGRERLGTLYLQGCEVIALTPGALAELSHIISGGNHWLTDDRTHTEGIVF